ncbi:aspartate/glutamate racemase family protein [uncultured Polaribacter sp.]|uniref:aspartate/glutamate racemase family protein n=1 Tax=uncultured Polaribacter sp. TaxID=174711 RepID=UPI002634F680|nr:aspartate/glutamate racemase family protein [uncultured Polaribacter sp.]
MNKIGLIGGITPESTILYYRILNRLNASKLGEKHSAAILINTLDFGEVSQLQSAGKWDLLNEMMANAGKSLENAGATCILICANTMHLCIDAVRKVVKIPVIHIAEATAKEITNQKLKKVALLGTKYTMEKDFFKEILISFGIEVIIPNAEDREEIHGVIYDELSKGEFNATSKENYINIINRQIKNGAEGIILGCTEIPLLIQQEDVSAPIFDTTKIHATAAFEFSNLQKNQ